MAHKSGKSSYPAKGSHPGRKGGQMMKGKMPMKAMQRGGRVPERKGAGLPPRSETGQRARAMAAAAIARNKEIARNNEVQGGGRRLPPGYVGPPNQVGMLPPPGFQRPPTGFAAPPTLGRYILPPQLPIKVQRGLAKGGTVKGKTPVKPMQRGGTVYPVTYGEVQPQPGGRRLPPTAWGRRRSPPPPTRALAKGGTVKKASPKRR